MTPDSTSGRYADVDHAPGLLYSAPLPAVEILEAASVGA
jgi:hypothetical protein